MKATYPLVLVLAAACGVETEPEVAASEGPEAVSLLGRDLVPAAPSAERLAELETNLAAALADYELKPEDEEAIVWYGRRLAYLGRYREAVDVYGRGIELHPESHKLLRHRGHRYITLRKLDAAITDLARAAELIRDLPDEVEPDGAPNERGIPTSTSHTNIYYHLALAHFLSGDFEAALPVYRDCLRFSKNPDMQSATTHWLYMTLRRLGRDAEAREVLEPIHAELAVIENFSYFHLLLMYKGERDAATLLEGKDPAAVDYASAGFGLGHWYLVEGREDEAYALFEEIVGGPTWQAFGFLGAEAELARR